MGLGRAPVETRLGHAREGSTHNRRSSHIVGCDRKQELHSSISAVEQRMLTICGNETRIFRSKLPPIFRVPDPNVEYAISDINYLVARVGQHIAPLAWMEFDKACGEKISRHC